ncbi:MAG: carbon-nitrogen hydrolase family protein [Candidatus Eremiobacteraeota bacterium]|nr:carbon-nitrogen hydrolase family protein [Candidatus Eremiobacteraeota bacterium]
MSRSIRVAAVQLEAHDRADFADRVDAILTSVRAVAGDADLVVLPEGSFPAYVLGSAPLDWAPIEAAVERLREIARATSTVVVAGAAARADRTVRNSAIVLDSDGSIAGRADKFFLWHFDRRWFARGEGLAPIQTSLGALGVLVCADGRIPTIARTLVDRGAVALVMPTAWVTSGRNPSALDNVQADLLARVRAYENRVPFIAANKCGSELGMVAYCGKSQIVDANGEVVAIAGERRAETLLARVELPDRARPRRTARNASPSSAVRDGEPLRIAISFQPLPADIDERLEVVDASYAVAPGDDARLAMLMHGVGAFAADDEVIVDPAGLVPLRQAGIALVVWTSDLETTWVERIARARALELRLFVIAFDRRAKRAFAVDPDGSVIAGTFGGFTLASFSFDRRKTAETSVAPGSDIAQALERVEALR